MYKITYYRISQAGKNTESWKYTKCPYTGKALNKHLFVDDTVVYLAAVHPLNMRKYQLYSRHF